MVDAMSFYHTLPLLSEDMLILFRIRNNINEYALSQKYSVNAESIALFFLCVHVK
jgi:hypothetical protein